MNRRGQAGTEFWPSSQEWLEGVGEEEGGVGEEGVDQGLD